VSTGAQKDLFANEGTASNLSNQLTANAGNVYGGLEPTLAAESAHPAGFTPAQKAMQNTAAQQSAGGSTAEAVGQGGLYAARTRNAGAGSSAIGNAVRSAGAGLSKNAVGTETNSANLARQTQQQGIKGLEGLNSTELGEGENALGLSNEALKLEEASPQSYWRKEGQGLATQGINTLINSATMGIGGGGG